MLELDHLVVACLDLDDGDAWLRRRLGVALAPGGRHTGWGTHNRLLQLGAGVYLELIAPDPDAPDPQGPRPFRLDDPDGLAKWAAPDRCAIAFRSDADALARRAYVARLVRQWMTQLPRDCVEEQA